MIVENNRLRLHADDIQAIVMAIEPVMRKIVKDEVKSEVKQALKPIKTEIVNEIIIKALQPIRKQELRDAMLEVWVPIKAEINLLKDYMIKTWQFTDHEYLATATKVVHHDKLLQLHGQRINLMLKVHEDGKKIS